jgi:hypothetical protein
MFTLPRYLFSNIARVHNLFECTILVLFIKATNLQLKVFESVVRCGFNSWNRLALELNANLSCRHHVIFLVCFFAITLLISNTFTKN